MAACSPIYGVSICTGAGGLDRGVKRAIPALRAILYVEREVSAASILAARMQDGLLDEAPVYSDLGNLCGPECSAYLREATGGRGIDAMWGGIPCQPHSVAGKKLGADDERDLWPATVRAIEFYRPWLFILENVPNMLGYVSARAVPDLRRLGFFVPRPILLEAAGVGASQKRERLFLLAYSERNFTERRGGRGDLATACELLEGEAWERQRRWDASDAGGATVLPTGELACGDSQSSDIHGRQCAGLRPAAGGSEGVELASSPKRGRGVLRKPSGRDRRTGGGNGTVDESDDSERRTDRPKRKTRRGGPALGKSSGDLEHARRERGQESGPAIAEESGARPGRTKASDIRRDRLGLFPPGPGFGLDRVAQDVLESLERGEAGSDDRFLAELAQWARWQKILEVRPDLAPALSEEEAQASQSEVCLLADGISGELGVSRADQLRAYGNGVVELQAAVAIRMLIEKLRAHS